MPKFYVRVVRTVYYETTVEAATAEDAANDLQAKDLPADPTDYEIEADLYVFADDEERGAPLVEDTILFCSAKQYPLLPRPTWPASHDKENDNAND